MIPIVMVLIAMNSRLGEKTTLLLSRMLGEDDIEESKIPMTSTQPLVLPPRDNAHQFLPEDRELTAMPQLTDDAETPPAPPDFSAHVTQGHASEPMAANDFMGNGGMTSWLPN